MTDPTRLLATDAPEGARLLALDGLEQVRHAWCALADAPTCPEALHALRVALTRLRATLRLYAPLLNGGIGRRGGDQLRAAHAALGPLRTRDVQALQLTRLAPSLDPVARDGARWLVERLAAERSDRMRVALRTVAAQLDPSLDRWHKRLRHYTVRRRAGEPPPRVLLAEVVVRALQQATEAIEATAQAARDRHTPRQLHRLRLTVKQLRALLVPWRSTLPNAAPLLALATQLQDDIGDARDAHLLARRARRAARRAPAQAPAQAPALRALAAQLAERARAARMPQGAQGHSDTVNNAVRQLLATVPPVAATLAAIGRPDEEIERKFLLHALPARVQEHAGLRIAQGWLPGARLRERLRRTVYPDGRVEWTRTVKLGTGIARVEIEEDTPAELFESLWPLTARARVEKVRYEIAAGAFLWQVDVFLDRELLLAEVELPSADTPVTLPDWLAPCVTREVTGEPAFVNANLARARQSPTGGAVDGAATVHHG
jgi:CYTH domain-containing protein/CHAD domain-containing protein